MVSRNFCIDVVMVGMTVALSTACTTPFNRPRSVDDGGTQSQTDDDTDIDPHADSGSQGDEPDDTDPQSDGGIDSGIPIDHPEGDLLTLPKCTFANPIRDAESADPHVFYREGFYYFLYTTGDGVWVRKHPHLHEVGQATGIKVWGWEQEIKGHVWAPELHHIDGKWYIYASGSLDATVLTMRMFALEANSHDAQGTYTFHMLDSEAPAIDQTVWQDPQTGQLYMAWSQWDPEQSIFIAPMDDPLTIGTPRVKLSEPTNEWERIGWPVNEGPYFLKRGDTLHILFSVNGCSTPDYSLAQLTNQSGDYLDPSKWVKSAGYVFSRNDSAGVYGTGHHATIALPNGEWWLVYHGKSSTEDTNNDRSSRMQPFGFDEHDFPVFGTPVSSETRVMCPGYSAPPECNQLREPFREHRIPGKIQAEDFDRGCMGKAYYDVDLPNFGGEYRDTAVDIQPTVDIGGGFNVGWIKTGEWLAYTVFVDGPGTYEMSIRAATVLDENELHVSFNGQDRTGTIQVPNTGSFDTWTDVKQIVELPSGQQTMRLRVDAAAGGININWISFATQTMP